MKRLAIVLVIMLAVAGYASAQVTEPFGDVLGAHNIYGRGCIGCHAPHSGAYGNGAAAGSAGPDSGNFILWGENLEPLYGKTFNFIAGSVTIPNYDTGGFPASAHDGTFIVAACLSCHDGNVAKVGYMTGHTVETVTIGTNVFNPPTLLGNDGTTVGNYGNDHPVGPTVNPGCGGSYNWDCTVNANGTFSFTGTGSALFVTDYYDVTKGSGPLNNLASPAGGGAAVPGAGGVTSTTLWVTCTTCHDQHDMLYFNTAASGPPVIEPTHFFVRGWYNPGNSTTSNSAAQFCRTCHGGESNEMHGQTVPTS